MENQFDKRWGMHDVDRILQGVKDSIPANTGKNRKSVWAQFTVFCNARNYKLTSETSTEDLAGVLRDWAYNMRRYDGADYKESVVKTMWNLTAKMLQENYLNEHKVTFNPFHDAVFKSARDARDAKRRELQVLPEKRKLSSVAFTVEELHVMQNMWDEETPNGLQRKFYHVVAPELAWRGGEAANALVEHFVVEVDNFGKETGRIQYNPIFTKAEQGGAHACASSKWLSQNKDIPNQCPVRLFHKLIQRRQPTITTNRLFLTPNPFWEAEKSSGWFKNMPVGRNEVGKWTKQAAEKIGMDTKARKITNHSNRATAVTHLAKAGVPEQELMKITGHKNAQSIQTYLQMDIRQHESIIGKMRQPESVVSNQNLVGENVRNIIAKVSSSSATASAVISSPKAPKVVFTNCTLSNCTFN